MRTYRNIIRLWPSTAALASDVGANVKTVRQWHFRNRIPSTFWKGLVEAASRRGIAGVTLDLLAEIAASDQPGKAAA